MTHSLFQKSRHSSFLERLLPQDAKVVREAFGNAQKYSYKSGFQKAHCCAAFYTAEAVALSFFNSPVFFLRGVSFFVKDTFHLKLHEAFSELQHNSTSATKSLFLGTFGIALVALTFFFPKTTITLFGHVKTTSLTREKKREREIQRLSEELQQTHLKENAFTREISLLEKEKKVLEEVNKRQSAQIKDSVTSKELQKRITRLQEELTEVIQGPEPKNTPQKS